MSSSPRAAIVGVAESDLGRMPDKTVLQLQAQAARACKPRPYWLVNGGILHGKT
ncbi:MAG: hypothetical protein M3Y39_00980 [Chloroflexota bacterium]|nr:hypothetical protein [Chloroflexota bacterium]